MDDSSPMPAPSGRGLTHVWPQYSYRHQALATLYRKCARQDWQHGFAATRQA